jgi:hypothetical protein
MNEENKVNNFDVKFEEEIKYDLHCPGNESENNLNETIKEFS